MRGVGVLLCMIALAGCNGQTGYDHNAPHLTAEDSGVLRRVMSSPLGKMDLMREVVSPMVTDTGSLEECDYSVLKTIDRKGPKDQDGMYPYHYIVKCLTHVGESPEIQFAWDVDPPRGFDVTGFRWGWDPFDLEDPDEP